MKKNVTNLKNTVSKPKEGLKHLKLVGVGREYIKDRLIEMRKTDLTKRDDSNELKTVEK